jgi:hypothetical protein
VQRAFFLRYAVLLRLAPTSSPGGGLNHRARPGRCPIGEELESLDAPSGTVRIEDVHREAKTSHDLACLHFTDGPVELTSSHRIRGRP